MDAIPRRRDPHDQPMSVYELHVGSWRPGLGYRELADHSSSTSPELGFTHVEFMPLAEHPFGGSWGYQVTGYYAPTSRFGHPDDLRYLIDRLHQAGIGVIVDWVPAHFPKDEWALANFDGQPLYEHTDPRRGEQLDWGTLVFDFGTRRCATSWSPTRCTGSRSSTSTACASMPSPPCSTSTTRATSGCPTSTAATRTRGDQLPAGGQRHRVQAQPRHRHDRRGVDQLPGRHPTDRQRRPRLRPEMEHGLDARHPPVHQVDPMYRAHHHHDITFSFQYAFSENFMLPISHDEVVHGKGSLLGKMPGDQWQKLANLRAYLAFMWAHPGKQLLFMGQEFGQPSEWSEQRGLDWWILDQPVHQGLHRLVGN
jgi:1,4-alpha-glucan branching enzyme